MDARRPGSVTLVVVLTWISAVLAVLGGLLLIVAGSVTAGAAGLTPGVLVGIGVAYVILGLITGAVASRLGRGGNGARLLVSVLVVLQIAGGIAAISTVGTGSTLTQALVSILVGIVILLLLWNARANAFFASH
ncbi:hypothetical protein GCM10023215_03940 [Pseudonocardia yuanmonensis]|uniref:Integral membrane protein n=1 Tax=Pseudonocardia yuanmonensis TaxID=1095914 RepID=A0ABP8VZZ8_9PSEU